MRILLCSHALFILYLAVIQQSKTTLGSGFKHFSSVVNSNTMFKIVHSDSKEYDYSEGEGAPTYKRASKPPSEVSNIFSVTADETKVANESAADPIAQEKLSLGLGDREGVGTNETCEEYESLESSTEPEIPFTSSASEELEGGGLTQRNHIAMASKRTYSDMAVVNQRPSTPKSYISSNEIRFPRIKLMNSIIRSMFAKMILRKKDLERMHRLSKLHHESEEEQESAVAKINSGRGIGIQWSSTHPVSIETKDKFDGDYNSEDEAEEMDSDSNDDSEQISHTVSVSRGEKIDKNDPSLLETQHNSSNFRKANIEEKSVPATDKTPRIASAPPVIETAPPELETVSPENVSNSPASAAEDNKEEGIESVGLRDGHNDTEDGREVGIEGDDEIKGGVRIKDDGETEDKESDIKFKSKEDKEDKRNHNYSTSESDTLRRFQQSIIDDQEHYYRGPGNVCFTKDKIEKKLAALKTEGNYNLIAKHEIERKRCWWFTRTTCSVVDRNGSEEAETRCICKNGYTWEGGACMAYHEQPCRWSADCVANARCNMSSDAFQFEHISDGEASETTTEAEEGDTDAEVEDEDGQNEKDAVKKDATVKRRKLRAVNADSSDSSEEISKAVVVSGKRSMKKMMARIKLDHKGQETDSDEEHKVSLHKSLDKHKKRLLSMPRQSFKAYHSKYAQRLHELQQGPIRPTKFVRMDPKEIQKGKSANFEKGVCVCHPVLKCARVPVLPPFVNEEEEQEEKNLGGKLSPTCTALILVSFTLAYFPVKSR